MIAPSKTMQQHSTPATRQATILIADDDYDLRNGLAMRLQAAGYCAHAVGDGRSAIIAVDEGAIDLAILDVKMPDMDGFEICEIIRKSSDMPIVFLTGCDDPLVRNYLPEMSEATGGDYFLRKPCDHDVLLTLIQDLLEK